MAPKSALSLIKSWRGKRGTPVDSVETIHHVDAFTDVPFHGNPAAVCVLRHPRASQWMQEVAAEMNLSETAFLWPQAGSYILRWYTPALEVDLCGHATLAAAHVLWQGGWAALEEEITFHTRSGILTAQQSEMWEECIELDFPSEPAEEAEAPKGLAKALGVKPVFVGKNRMDYLVEVESPQILCDVNPDYAALAGIESRGVILTACSDQKDCDFVSRFFAPQSGIPEDPVTGSAHCCLAPYWSGKLSKPELFAYQASARGGWVRARMEEDRVILGGQAVTVMRGTLL
ncbi:MAG: PhzF family phenazine biosynthesis protein [Candidatus Omnitrophica bacterium]|nr:PhzF family phenazine biosynthesis protein [Candidatus Omnitrophota bacterium]